MKIGSVVQIGKSYFLLVRKNQWRQLRSTGLFGSFVDEDLSDMGNAELRTVLSGDVDLDDLQRVYSELTKREVSPSPREVSTSSRVAHIDFSELRPYIPYGKKIVALVLSGQNGEARSKNGVSETVHGTSPGAANIGSGQVIIAPGNRYAVWSDSRTVSENKDIVKGIADWKTTPISSFRIDKKDVWVDGDWRFPLDSVAPCFASVQDHGPVQAFLAPNPPLKVLIFRAGEAIAFVSGAYTERQLAEAQEESSRVQREAFERLVAATKAKEEAEYKANEERRAAQAKAREAEEKELAKHQKTQQIKDAIDQIAAWKKGYIRVPHPMGAIMRLSPESDEYKEQASRRISGLLQHLYTLGVNTNGHGKVLNGEWAAYEPEPLRWHAPKGERERQAEVHWEAIQSAKGPALQHHVDQLRRFGVRISDTGKLISQDEEQESQESKYDSYYANGWEAVKKARSPKAENAEKEFKKVRSTQGSDWIEGYRHHASLLEYRANNLPVQIPGRALKLGLTLKDYDKAPTRKKSEPEPEEGADIYLAHIEVAGERIDLDVGLTLDEEAECIQKGCTFVVHAQTAEDKGELLRIGMTSDGPKTAKAVIKPKDEAAFRKIYKSLRNLSIV